MEPQPAGSQRRGVKHCQPTQHGYQEGKGRLQQVKTELWVICADLHQSEPIKYNGTMNHRVIMLNKLGNMQNDYFFLSLMTMRKVLQHQYTKLLMIMKW